MKKLSILICIFCVSGLYAQERLTDLKYNSALFNQTAKNDGFRDVGITRDTLCLPFFDDFSNLHVFLDSVSSNCGDTIYHTASFVYPNNLFWSDSDAYINKTYPILPPSYGVATLDGLNQYGRPYNESLPYGAADTLTSKPIYLGGILTGSVFLSFEYQPGGYGDFPENIDSLAVDFRNADSSWTTVWSVTNLNGDVNQNFKLQMLEVAGSEFLYDGFQFRFRNYASIFGNNDHWNIDYVYLSDNRTISDSIFRDVSFTGLPTSFLKNYNQMPWNQFKDHQEEETNDQVFIQMVNNFNDIVNTAHSYSAYEKYSGDIIVPSTAPISENFAANSYLFNIYNTFTIPSTVSGYDEDSLTVEFKYVLDPSSDIRRINDTLYYDLPFYNYFAYDDGTAEKAYGLEGIGARLAVQFHANEPDTLKEIYVHWAHVDGSNSSLFFSVMVWNSIDTSLLSSDEDIAYEADFLTPKYVDSINGFYVYQLTDFLGNPTPVAVDGDFYVGWLQTQSDLLDVGFDTNNNASQHVYYNVGGTWQKSTLPGAVMIRPRVGGDYSKYTPLEENKVVVNKITVYPDPASSEIHFNNTFTNAVYTIFDYAGSEMLRNNLSGNTIDIGNLNSGFYILRIDDPEKGKIYLSKFIRE